MPHKDPAARAAYWKSYRKEHRALSAQRTRDWRSENPGRNAENARSWRQRNPEKAAASQKKWRAANPEKVRESRRRWLDRVGYAKSAKRIAQSLKDWLKKYGLTPESYKAILDSQNGECAICRSTHPRMRNAKRLYVDHCHISGRVRGLVCFRCNSLLSNAADSVQVLEAAIKYLEAAHDCGPVRRTRGRLLES